MSVSPQLGEIWEDARGILALYGSKGRWWLFGDSSTVGLETLVEPLEQAFDVHGNYMLDRPLRYPSSTNVVSQQS